MFSLLVRMLQKLSGKKKTKLKCKNYNATVIIRKR